MPVRLPIFPALATPATSVGTVPGQVESWLIRFRLDPFVHKHAATVLARLPQAVRADMMEDPGFNLCDYEPMPGKSFSVPMRLPVRNRASRSVVLKRTLRNRSEAFARWLIAHEFAHAHLRHEGRTPGEDPEDAADALAAEWGFPKPRREPPWW